MTHWSVVLAAGDGEEARAAAALEKLCNTYWYPIYGYIRRKGYQPADAADLTQDFFARLISRRDLSAVRPDRGRFRSYLLVALNHFLINEWKRTQAQCRGGGQAFVPLDRSAAENLYRQEPETKETGETVFECRWATALLQQVLNRLEQEYTRCGRRHHFELLRTVLVGEPATRSYAEIGQELGMTENALKQAVHRMRRRYRELLREEVAQTVATAEEIEDELRHLVAVLRR